MWSVFYTFSQIMDVAHFTNVFYVSVYSNISDMRKVYKDAFLKKHNIKLGFMSAFVKAAAYALVDQPAVNAGKVLIAS